jgi:drug/metabolite transporter (DMT)-like permease
MRARLLAAFAAVYIIWGSTYLAIRFAVETLPPLLMAGVRFLIAGSILLFWARLREEATPRKIDWRTGFIGGALLLAGGNGAVVWAEQLVPSGIAALLVAVVPVWVVVLEWLRPGGRRPRLPVFVGLALGLLGLALLVGPEALHGGGSINLIGAAVLMVGALCWALGSLYTRSAPKPASGSIGSGTQMFAGGVCLVIVALLTGELRQLDLAHASARSLLGFAYLVTFGSLIGFTAYIYLLGHTTAAKAATYAYVNPVVAVLLGWAFASEPITARTLVAAAVILAGVAIITITRDAGVTAAKANGRRAAA